MPEFADFFRLATGRDPYPYQVRLGDSPCISRALQVPTGAGKTAAAIVSWLYRLKSGFPDAPRRMVYCLPMRVLVEQTLKNAAEWIQQTGSQVETASLMGGDVDQA